MPASKPPPQTLSRAGLGAYFRPRDLERLGISYRSLQKLVAEGEVERVGDGLYRLTSVQPTELETIAMVASAIPAAIVCLLTALRVHDIGTQSPDEVWIAIDRKARKPTRAPARVRVVRFSGAMLSYGVQTLLVMRVPVKITSPARTIVDCFRYRNKLGLEVALEALQDGIGRRRVPVQEIVRAAQACRVYSVLRPYLEATLS
jgi:predicted transcriptional regulator of viral defense system